ncbi:hypothetical protein VP1G_08135 [Cytospora mali]|uniref:Uncharacterized protein n=1 Tax=Cytospora mali TaxID=578113 RepID=A0A194VAX6_CYTMA|nr:hypothetical protein VP1G_08135 [Valsa mali var. pyri (nom. inval.)]
MLPPLAWCVVLLAVGVIYLAKLKFRSGQRHDKPEGVSTSEKQDGLPSCPMSSVEPMAGFQWTQKEPLKFRPFKPVYHITMALQNSSPADLIVMDRNYKDHILERRQLMIDHPSIVVGATPRGKAAVQEMYAYLLSEYLPKRYPSMFSLSDDGKKFHNQVIGTSFPTLPPDDALEALRTIGETIEDDMFLLHETNKGHRSVAYVCCYPSGFDPSEKLDKLLDEIHEPVPSYNKIGPSMERFFSRVKVGKNAKRVNWSVVDSPILFNCKGNHVHGEDVEEVIEDEDIDISQARMRVELQTVSRLPATGAVVFSFKTHLYTLEEIKADGMGDQLADAIDGLGKGNAPGMWTYKGAIRWGKKVKEYLRS